MILSSIPDNKRIIFQVTRNVTLKPIDFTALSDDILLMAHMSTFKPLYPHCGIITLFGEENGLYLK